MSGTSISSIALAALPLHDALSLLAPLKVDQVTLGVRQVADAGWAQAQHEVATSGLRIGSVSSGLTCPVDAYPDRRRAELVRARHAVDWAASMEIPLVTLTTGPAGRLSWEDALDVFATQVRPLVRHAGELGVGLTLENTHSLRSDVSFLHALRDTVAAARHAGTGVVADLYCAWAERDLLATLTDGLDVIRVVQFADFVHGTLSQPNRWVPGDGDLPLDRLLDEVVSTGYAGPYELELLGPRIDAEGFGPAHVRALDWLGSRLGRVG